MPKISTVQRMSFIGGNFHCFRWSAPRCFRWPTLRCFCWSVLRSENKDSLLTRRPRSCRVGVVKKSGCSRLMAKPMVLHRYFQWEVSLSHPEGP